MPDTTQQRQASQTTDLEDTLSDLIDANKRALAQWLHGTQALSDEAWSIARARMQLTMEACSALLSCRSPEQMAEQQRRYMAKGMERYAEELTSLSQLAMKAPSSEQSK